MSRDLAVDEIDKTDELADIASSIMGLSQTLLDELETEFSAEHKLQLSAIHNASRKLLVKFLEKNTTLCAE